MSIPKSCYRLVQSASRIRAVGLLFGQGSASQRSAGGRSPPGSAGQLLPCLRGDVRYGDVPEKIAIFNLVH